MAKNLEQLIEATIKAELSIADLYFCFMRAFPADSAFWRQMVLEEKNHATLIRAAKESALAINLFPAGLVGEKLEVLNDFVEMLVSLKQKYEMNTPSREEAFNIALYLEESASEAHYQQFMEGQDDSQVVRLFHKLNQGDKNHAKRIFAYMQRNNIEFCHPEQTVKHL